MFLIEAVMSEFFALNEFCFLSVDIFGFVVLIITIILNIYVMEVKENGFNGHNERTTLCPFLQ